MEVCSQWPLNTTVSVNFILHIMAQSDRTDAPVNRRLWQDVAGTGTEVAGDCKAVRQTAGKAGV